MIPMAANYFLVPTPIHIGENYHTWAMKMNVYLKGLSLWEVVENDVDSTTLPLNPTLLQLKKG